MLLKHFSSFRVHVIPLNMPEDVKDTWWADTMVVIKAIK
jgi:guanidinoacetate N-methyltransferase